MCNPVEGRWPEGPSRKGTDVTVQCKDGTDFNVHVSRPDGEPPYATVLIVHDYFDCEVYYHELADRYAGQGYLAVVPNFFHRHGHLTEQTHEAAGQRIGDVSDAEVYEDFDVVLDYLRGEALLGDLVITGFCWGGRMAYLLTARHPEAKLLVPFYGHLTAWSGPDGPKPDSPLRAAADIKVPVVGAAIGADESIPLDQVREMEERLNKAGARAELKVYDGAEHCFFMTPANAEQSDDAWARVLAALKEAVG
ncbi:MAG: carboxymethylenebutenolidase [Chloroflexota bacterium]|jgi:carboxymethylenebutenolidase|nr:carboxymethylenebutenolidase [Chloroflexota bacterium]